MKYFWIALVAFIVLPLNAQDKKKLKPVEVTGYNHGDKVADFSLVNIDGEMVSLADYKEAEGFIVMFSCNHCPYSIAYEDRIIDLANKYAEENIPLVMISSNDVEQYPEDGPEEMKVRAAEKEFPFPYLFDESQEVARRFGATRTPHVFLLNKDLILTYFGAIDDSARDANSVETKYLEDAITSMKNGVAFFVD